MRYLILTDIHANLEGLEACLADARTRGYDATIVLGDIVGYGPDPNAVIDIVQALRPVAIVRGNHDKVALGLEQAEAFHAAARTAAMWMLNSLTLQHREWLADLPSGPLVVESGVEICHGSPFDEDAYIFDELDARQALQAATESVCFYGHTHFAVAFRLAERSLEIVGPAPDGTTVITLDGPARYLVNPGSVGQPRDGDPRAAYALFDATTKRLDMIRVSYPIETTQGKILQAGLPEPLARRLALGR